MIPKAIRPTDLETQTFTVTKLLGAIQTGRVRIPRFQRAFRWGDEDRRLLFDSLQSGYPLGTLLLARGAAPADRVTLGGFSVEVEARTDALWIVDGQQRLTTIAMALLGDHSGTYRKLYFDLEQDQFVLGPRRRQPKPTWVPTSVLANSATLNRWLREASISDELSERADAIASRVRDYTLPAYLVPFDGADDSVLKEIFKRINVRGKALESHEVFEAMHGSITGRASPFDVARADLAQLRFGTFQKKTLERAARAVGGRDPGEELAIATDEVPELLRRVVVGLRGAVEFLANDVGCPHLDLMPYEGPLFTLARYFEQHPSPHPRNRELLARWFWLGSVTGGHKGDWGVDRRNWHAIDDDETESVQRLLRLLPQTTVDDILTELSAFRRNVAQSRLEVLAMLALSPVELVGDDAGRPIDVAALMEDGTLPTSLPGADVEKKTVASMVLHPALGALDDVAEQASEEMLETHLLDRELLERLRRGDAAGFVAARTERVLQHVRAHLADRSGLNSVDRNHRPLDAYLAEETA